MTRQPDGLMHDQADEKRTLRAAPDDNGPDVMQQACRDVHARFLHYANTAGSGWHVNDIACTAVVDVLTDAETQAANAWDPYAHLGSATAGVLKALRELGAVGE